MGLFSALIGWLAYVFGLRTDTASSTGSAMAKLKSILDLAASCFYHTLTYARVSVPGSVTWDSGSENSYTGPSYSGSGVIKFIRFVYGISSSYTMYARIVITIDGVDYGIGVLQGSGSYAPGNDVHYAGRSGNPDTKYQKDFINIPFKTGFTSTLYTKRSGSGSSAAAGCVIDIFYTTA